MDFLLECVGFPPDFDADSLLELVHQRGEAIPYRDRGGQERRLGLGGGLELRLDPGPTGVPGIVPWFSTRERLRVAVEHLEALPDAPFDALLAGRANPPLPSGAAVGTSFPFATYLADRRRLPERLPHGHVLAISTAGFALDVVSLRPEPGADSPDLMRRPCLGPLGGPEDPAGCMEIDTRLLHVERCTNPITGLDYDVLTADAPGRPLTLFASRWQLDADGWGAPRPGWRIEGVFLFQGRVAGGLPRARLGHAFG